MNDETFQKERDRLIREEHEILHRETVKGSFEGHAVLKKLVPTTDAEKEQQLMDLRANLQRAHQQRAEQERLAEQGKTPPIALDAMEELKLEEPEPDEQPNKHERRLMRVMEDHPKVKGWDLYQLWDKARIGTPRKGKRWKGCSRTWQRTYALGAEWQNKETYELFSRLHSFQKKQIVANAKT